jgi:TonB family protein
MSAATFVAYRAAVLPWTGSSRDERRFRKILLQVMLLCLLLGVLIRVLPVPKVDRAQPEELSPRLAKLMLENRPVPPPPVIKPQPAPEPTKSVLPERVTPRKERENIPVPEARQPVPNKPPGEALEAARKKAAGVGLLAMKEELQEMHGAPMALQLKPVKPGPGVGTGVGAGVGSGSGLGIPTRSMITSNATGGSGGINTAGYSRDTGGGGLAGRSTTLVQGVAGGGGGGGPGGGGVGGTLQRGGDGKASRSIEEIKLVFERNKGAIYAIYNRALREDPTLQGKVVVELKIAPSGQVLDVHVVSSELKDADLERKLLARIRQFDFGAKDVAQMVVTWPVDFLPS